MALIVITAKPNHWCVRNHAGFVHALVVTITSAGGATLGPVRLSKAPQPCFTQSSCDTFYATAPCKLGTLEEAKVSMRRPA